MEFLSVQWIELSLKSVIGFMERKNSILSYNWNISTALLNQSSRGVIWKEDQIIFQRGVVLSYDGLYSCISLWTLHWEYTQLKHVIELLFRQ